MAQVLIGGNERFLRGVAGRVALAHDAVGQVVDRGLIFEDQPVKGVQVAPLGLEDERRFVHGGE